MNYNWFYNEGDLTALCSSGGSIDWESFGFSVNGVRWAVANGYQKPNADGVMISMFPIENMDLFQATLGAYIEKLNIEAAQVDASELAPWDNTASGHICCMIDQAECDRIHAELVALEEAKQTEDVAEPTADDIYKAQQLLLLTEISNGLSELKSSDTTA